MGLISIQQLPEVKFDVNSPEHALAYAMLMFGDRQHPTLRFVLELPYGDVPSMMQAKISEKYCRELLGENFPVKGKETNETLSSSCNNSIPAVVRKPQLRQVANG